MSVGELVLRDRQSRANLPKYFLMLCLLLLAHFLHDSLILDPIVRQVGLASALHAFFNVHFLALLCDLRLTVDQAQEVISVQTTIVIFSGVVGDFGEALFVQLIRDELLAHLSLLHS